MACLLLCQENGCEGLPTGILTGGVVYGLQIRGRKAADIARDSPGIKIAEGWRRKRFVEIQKRHTVGVPFSWWTIQDSNL